MVIPRPTARYIWKRLNVVSASRIDNPSVDGSGHPTFNGHGIPGYTYGVERSTDLTTWVNAGPDQASSTVTAGANGSWSFTDATQTSPSPVFYRLYYPIFSNAAALK